MEELDEVSEAALQAGEDRPADHDHGGVALTEEALGEHLRHQHRMDAPTGLSLSTLQGMHDRFHGEAHAIDE